MKKILYVLICCALFATGCSVPMPRTESEAQSDVQKIQCNMYIVDASAYYDDSAFPRFITTWISEDETKGFVIRDRNVYWDYVEEITTNEKELHAISAKCEYTDVMYFNVEDKTYFEYKSSLFSGGDWYDLSNNTQKGE